MQIRSKRNNLSKMGLLILGSSLLLIGCGKDNKVVYDVDSITVKEEDNGVIYVPENSESVLTDRSEGVKSILKEEVVEPLKLTVGTVTYDSYEDYNKAYEEFYDTLYPTDGSFFEIENNGDGTCTITDYLGDDDYVIIPTEIEGLTVTKLGTISFATSYLTNVVIAPTIQVIEENAFSNNELTSISIPSSVTKIEDSAFTKNRLQSVTLPNTITSIEEYSFYDNKLATFQIPESVTTIEDGALGTNKLTTIHFPSSLTSIGVHAFQTNNLEAIYLPDSIESVGYEAFRTNFIKTVYAPSHIENEFMVNFVFDLQTPTVTFY